MKIKLLYAALLFTFCSLGVKAQNKELKNQLAENLNGIVTLFLINDQAYLGDSTCTIMQGIENSSIYSISAINDKESVKYYVNKLSKPSDKITGVLIIRTHKEDDFVYTEDILHKYHLHKTELK